MLQVAVKLAELLRDVRQSPRGSAVLGRVLGRAKGGTGPGLSFSAARFSSVLKLGISILDAAPSGIGGLGVGQTERCEISSSEAGTGGGGAAWEEGGKRGVRGCDALLLSIAVTVESPCRRGIESGTARAP